jgi:hypothetical protein
MTDDELKALVAENSLAIRESRQESERLWQEILVSRQETDRLIRGLSSQFGQLGNELGDYAESLIRPSLERALREQFGMTTIHSPLHLRRNGDEIEIDVMGYAEDQRQEVYLAEIKSQLRQEGIDQILDDLRRFPRFFPEHGGKKLFGILAALDVPADLRAQVLKQGLYLATIRDDVFEIVPPDGFAPRAFGEA